MDDFVAFPSVRGACVKVRVVNDFFLNGGFSEVKCTRNCVCAIIVKIVIIVWTIFRGDTF